MPVGEFPLKLYVIVGVAADIAGSARAGSDIVQRFFHRYDYIGMLSHRQIIVRTPDGHRLRAVVMCETTRVRKRTLVAQNVDEYPIASFGMEPVNRLRKNLVVIHYVPNPASNLFLRSS